MISVPASEVQRNFSEYEEKAVHEPIEVTRAGRSPSYLVSERLFKDMMSSYRRAIPVEALSDADIALIEKSEVQTDAPYDLEDIPDVNEAPLPAR
jgi:PHD/YefM family antitoxin component YafN of YafNO toxin-antitoxin module